MQVFREGILEESIFLCVCCLLALTTRPASRPAKWWDQGQGRDGTTGVEQGSHLHERRHSSIPWPWGHYYCDVHAAAAGSKSWGNSNFTSPFRPTHAVPFRTYTCFRVVGVRFPRGFHTFSHISTFLHVVSLICLSAFGANPSNSFYITSFFPL